MIRLFQYVRKSAMYVMHDIQRAPRHNFDGAEHFLDRTLSRQATTK